MTQPSEAPSTVPATDPPVSDEQSTAAAAAESERILSFKAQDSKTIANEIRRLERENEDFRGVFTNEVGRRAERQYTPVIKQREAEIAELKLQLRKQEYERMTEEQVNERFGKDEEFAVDYAKVMHHKPQPAAPVDETPLIVEAFEDVEQWAKSQGITDEAWGVYVQQVADGKYGDATTPWRDSIRRLERDVASAVVTMKTSKGDQPEDKKPAYNPALTSGGPDLSSTSKGNTHNLTIPKTASAFNNLPRATQLEILAQPGAMEAVAKLQG